VIGRVVVTDCDELLLESVTVTATGAVPTVFCIGVPATVPVELSIDNPLGSPAAENV
jgi:hypothetical protein